MCYGSYEFSVDYGFMAFRLWGGPHAVPACLLARPALSCPGPALAVPTKRLLQAYTRCSAQMRLADIVCPPSMVPLQNVEAGTKIRRRLIGHFPHMAASRGPSYGYTTRRDRSHWPKKLAIWPACRQFRQRAMAAVGQPFRKA